jgi:ABC-type uncharacterized transport system permease subunit
MITIGTIAILLYASTWLALTIGWRATLKHESTPSLSKHYLWTWIVGALCHAAYLYLPLFHQQQLALDFFSAASHVMWLAGLILLITSSTHKLESLSLFFLPFITMALLIQLTLSNPDNAILVISNGVGVHILSALLAYSMFMIAAIQAVLLAYQHKSLHNRKPNILLRTLPSLQDMDKLLFRFISVGLALLSLALLTGFIYLEDLFGQHIAHKTILSIIAWLVFSALIVGRWRYGWRGITATRWTLSGFTLLMLAFFGTKFVQEYLLTP